VRELLALAALLLLQGLALSLEEGSMVQAEVCRVQQWLWVVRVAPLLRVRVRVGTLLWGVSLLACRVRNCTFVPVKQANCVPGMMPSA
jgi:hypothetical protein